MFKSILVMLIVLYIYNTYISPISESVRRRRSHNGSNQGANNYQQQTQSSAKRPPSRKEDFIDYEEIKD